MKLEADPASFPLTESEEADSLCGSLNHTRADSNCKAAGTLSGLLMILILVLIVTFIVMVSEKTGIRRIARGVVYTLNQVMRDVQGIDERLRADGIRYTSFQDQLFRTTNVMDRVVTVMLQKARVQADADKATRKLIDTVVSRCDNVDLERHLMGKKFEEFQRKYYTMAVIPFVMGAEGKTPAEQLRNAVFGKYTIPETDPSKIQQLLGCPTPPGFVLDKQAADEFISEFFPGTRVGGSASYCWHLNALRKLESLGHHELVSNLCSDALRLFVSPDRSGVSTEVLPSQTPEIEQLVFQGEEDDVAEASTETPEMANAVDSLRELLSEKSESSDADDDEQLKYYLEELRQLRPSVTEDEEREHRWNFHRARHAKRYPLVERNPVQWGVDPDVDYDLSDIGRIVRELDTYQGSTMAPYKVSREIFSTKESLIALEAYHSMKVSESYIMINRKYGNLIGKMQPPRQLWPLAPPYCHIPEKYREKMQIPWKEFEHGGQYYGMKMISYDLLPTGKVNNLTVQSMLNEIAELEEEIEMDQLQGSPRWLNFCGRAPDFDPSAMELFVAPRQDRLVLSRALRSLLPMLRDFYTTDQACDCRRYHIPNQICAACDKFCLCPRHCRHCANSIDLQIDTFLKEGEIVVETPDVVHDILYHQLVFDQEFPAAREVKYPCDRDHSDVADLLTTRRRYAKQVVSGNALKYFNLAGNCLGHGCVLREHLVLRKKTGPKCMYPGTATFLDAQQIESFEEVELHEDEEGWLIRFDECPPTLNGRQAKDEAHLRDETGFGRANRGCTASDNRDEPVVRPDDYLEIHKVRAPVQWREPVDKNLVDNPQLVPLDRDTDEYVQGVHALHQRDLRGTVRHRGPVMYVNPRTIDRAHGPASRYNQPGVPPLGPRLQDHADPRPHIGFVPLGPEQREAMWRFLNLIHHSVYYNNRQAASLR